MPLLKTPNQLVLSLVLLQSAVALVMGYMPQFHGGPWNLKNTFQDVNEYFEYSGMILEGLLPYRDFRVEYPPLALPLFLPPRLAALSFEVFKILLSLEMLAFNAACLVLVARWTAARRGVGEVPRVLAWYTAFFVLCLPVSMARFDLAVMFTTFLAAAALISGRPTAGGSAAAASVLLKIFPGAVAGPAFLRELALPRESRLRGIVVAALALGVSGAAWVAICGPAGVLAMIRYHTERGLELGSLYAGLTMAITRLSGSQVDMAFNHWASHLESPGAMRLAALAGPIQLVAFLLALAAYWRSGFRDGLRYSTASLLAFIVFGKVLSPQYLIWLIPFFACLEGQVGRRSRVLFLFICLSTLLIYPYRWNWVTTASVRGIVLLNARNFALVALFGLLIFTRAEETSADAIPSSASLPG